MVVPCEGDLQRGGAATVHVLKDAIEKSQEK